MRKLIVAALVAVSCSASAQQGGSKALPHVIVYKTKHNYRNYVPVMLSADKKTVVSYPGPGDVTTGSGYPLPVVLHKGYLLDKRGVGRNSAFTGYTYEQYSKITTDITPDGLNAAIKDRNPMTELYDCGIRGTGKSATKQLNDLIDKGQLKKKCKQL